MGLGRESTANNVIDAGYERILGTKLQVFASDECPNKAIHLTMVAACGLARNGHAGIVVNEVCGDNLFS